MSKSNLKKFLSVILILLIGVLVLYQKDHFSNFSYGYEQGNIAENNVKVHFIDVGQADSILIQTENNNMLIDAGNNNDGEKLVSYLKSLGINKFSVVVATHPHEDHIGGMDSIINNFDIDKFYMTDVITTTKTFTDVLDALENKNLKYTLAKTDEIFTLDDANFRIVFANSEATELNNSSIVIKMTHGSNKFLFMGDAESEVEEAILGKDISADVLKVGHHGSRSSTGLKFLKEVKPTYAIISVGKDNSYNHPNNETLEKLNKNDVKVYRTDFLGTIILESDGKSININNKTTDTNGDK